MWIKQEVHPLHASAMAFVVSYDNIGRLGLSCTVIGSAAEIISMSPLKCYQGRAVVYAIDFVVCWKLLWRWT